MTHTSDGRECARAERCATSWTDDTGTRRGAWGPRPLCEPDRGHLIDTLTELPELYAWLWMQLPVSQTSAIEPVTTSGTGRTAPIPLRADIDALMREIIHTTAAWEERVRLIARLSDHPVGPHAGGPALTTITRTLTEHVDVLLALPAEPMLRTMTIQAAADLPPDTPGSIDPDAGTATAVLDQDGADAALELWDLVARARARAGMTRRVTPLQGVPCPRCDMVALVRTTGADHVHCEGCAGQMTDDDYDRWVALLAASVR